MAMNGHVRLGVSLPSLLTSLTSKAPAANVPPPPPPAPTTLPVEQTEVVGLVGGIGLFAGGTQVKGEAGLLMKMIGLIAAAASGYVIATKKAVIPDVLNVGTSAETVNTGLLSPTGMGPLRPLAPASAIAPTSAKRPTAAQDAATILTPFAPVLQRLIAPSQPQPTTTAAQRQQQQIVSASAPVATAAARAVTSGGGTAPAPTGTQSNPYGIVTEADLERSLQTPTKTPLNNPYGIVTEADLQRPTAPSNANPYGIVTEADLETSAPSAGVPNIVTSIDEGFSASTPELPGFVTQADIAPPPQIAMPEISAPEIYTPPPEPYVAPEIYSSYEYEPMDLAGIANGQ